MSLSALAAAIVALCRALPAAARLAELVAAQLAEQRRTAAHELIDQDRARILAMRAAPDFTTEALKAIADLEARHP